MPFVHVHLFSWEVPQATAPSCGVPGGGAARRLSTALKPGTVSYMIVQLLKSQPLKLWSAGEIAFVLREQPTTVSKALHRLKQRETLDGHPHLTYDPFRQSYKAFVEGDDMPKVERVEVKIHAFQIGLKVPQPGGWTPPPAARHVAWKAHDQSMQYTGRFEFEGRKGTIQYSVTTQSLLISLEANAHGQELSVPQAMEYVGFLEGLVKGQGLRFAKEYAEVRSVEFNQDFERLAISGMKRAMLRKWVNSWAQVYEKESGLLRREFRWHPEDRMLTTPEALAIIRAMQWAPHEERTEPEPAPRSAPGQQWTQTEDGGAEAFA